MEGVRCWTCSVYLKFGWSTQENTARSYFVGADDRLTMCTSSLSRKKPIAFVLYLSYIMYVINKSRILILQYERRIHTILPMHLIRASVKTNLHHEVSYHWPLVPLCISMCRVSKLGSDDRYVGLYAAFFAIGNLDRPKATTYTQDEVQPKAGMPQIANENGRLPCVVACSQAHITPCRSSRLRPWSLLEQG